MLSSLIATAMLYAEPAHQSPVRGEPDDLLLLAGYGLAADDTVVYEAGVAPVVSTSNVPYSLTVRLPQDMRSDRTYTLRVRDREGHLSNPVRINDPRPLWITPAFVYSTASLASLPRELKVVGRNLARTRVRLAGPQTLTLQARNDDDPATAFERFAAQIALPARLAPGTYSVSVSRDGASWISLQDQQLIVRPDPPSVAQFPVRDCKPDDALDDTRCILQAIAAAQAAGTGAVVFGPGVWLLDDSPGILVPHGVNLRGAGATVRVTDRWADGKRVAAFTLQGRNTVEGLTFRDARAHQPKDPEPPPMLRLGDRRSPAEDIVITHNVFDGPRVAIRDGGQPLARLFVTYNEFGAYATGLAPAGNRFNTLAPFRVDDSVIAHNRFEPGDYVDAAIHQGAIASMLGASYRVDFSENIADGTSTRYAKTAPGWRAAFFFHLNGNHEKLLVARNVATCTGDKSGDGEAISYDNNGNTFAFDRAVVATAATANSVTVRGTLQSRQNDRDVPLDRYYVGHWIQIGQGPGVGQSRKIVAYRIDGEAVTFQVAPAWDVTPAADTSRVTVARQYWQVFTVDNRVDHRTPLCRKSNRNNPKGGAIALWAQTADSVVEGNRQYDADGILFYQAYSVADRNACRECRSWTSQHSFVEIRGNLIDGEYDWRSDCSRSGIGAWNAAAPVPTSPPPVASFGVSISHNTIRRADGLRGGAISVPLGWHQGPPPHDWTVVNNLLIHHNTLTGLAGAAPVQRCDVGQRGRVGINLHQAGLVWRTVLYANSCTDVAVPLYDSAHLTERLCSGGPADSCECAR